MAHASTREKGILQMKKVRKAKSKKRLEENQKIQEMTEKERKQYEFEKNRIPLKRQVSTALWDYDHHQYPPSKFRMLEQILKDRLKEIEETQETNCDEEVTKIRGVLNSIIC